MRSPAERRRLAGWSGGVLAATASPTQAPHHTLSEREMEVLQLIGAGKSLKAIAAQLALSVKSVSTYRARVLEKMTMSTNADLIRYVVENNLRL